MVAFEPQLGCTLVAAILSFTFVPIYALYVSSNIVVSTPMKAWIIIIMTTKFISDTALVVLQILSRVSGEYRFSFTFAILLRFSMVATVLYEIVHAVASLNLSAQQLYQIYCHRTKLILRPGTSSNSESYGLTTLRQAPTSRDVNEQEGEQLQGPRADQRSVEAHGVGNIQEQHSDNSKKPKCVDIKVDDRSEGSLSPRLNVEKRREAIKAQQKQDKKQKERTGQHQLRYPVWEPPETYKKGGIE
ncbi:MAG: hypothetical protein Q9210_007467 [Variospora velana]